VADTRISALTRLPEAGVSPTDLLPIADLSASETKAITAKDLLEGVVISMDAGSIPASKIDFSTGIAVSSIGVTQGDVVLGRISGAGTAEEIPCTAVGRALLAGADVAAQRTSLGLGTLALRSGSWVDGSTFSGTSSGTNTGDQTITLTGPVTGSGTGTFATSIAAGAVGSVELAVGGVGTANLADDAVTSAKLADQSAAVVGAGAPGGAGAFIGQGGFNTANGVAYTYTATGWVQHAGVQSLAVTEASTPLAITTTSGAASAVSIDLDTQVAATVWAGPTSGADAKPSFRKLVGTDLPVATATVAGAVLPGTGTAVAADGKLGLAPATTTTIGGVIVKGPELSVAVDGGLTHAASALAPGTYVKVTTDAAGHVASGLTQLVDADIAGVDASKITSGSLDPARLGNRTIKQEQLADYAISFIQEAPPPSVNTYHNGMLWFQESTGQLRMWNGNSWFPIGAGRLTAENLRYCGVFDAATGTITGITQFGTGEGFKIGDLIPPATDALAGVYLVCSVPGSGTAQAATIAFDAGDWIMCNGSAAGWVRIDTLNSAGGGGGGGASSLNDLLDVTLTAEVEGNFLRLNNAGQWVNVRTFSQGTAAPTSPTPVAGALFLDTTVSTKPVLKIWDGGKWVVAGGAGGVTSGATAPSSPALGDTWINSATVPPTMGIWDGSKWVTLAPSDSPAFTGKPTAPTAPVGTDDTQLATTAFVQAAQLLSKAGTTLSAKTAGDLLAPGILPAATTAAQGAVQLADAAAITAGTAGRVVDAAQLKAVNVWTRTGTTLGAATAGDLVAPAVLPAATTAAQGAVQLATSAEAAAGTDAAKAVTPKALADGYLAKNIALLPALP